jgi:putative ABC transport system permease protein
VEGIVEIGWEGLAWSLLLVAVTAAISWWQKLGLERNLCIGCLRTVLQLLLIGYILGWVIDAGNPYLVLAAITVQLAVTVWTAGSLVKPRLPGLSRVAFLALLPTYLVIMAVLILLIIQPPDWWNPRLVLTLGGMLLGNSLTGVVLAINRYRERLADQRDLVLARLSLGLAWRAAVVEQRRSAASTALTPTITSLMTVGLVAFPGMMTGQIIAGADPLVAVRYQIVVMFFITTAVALASTIALDMLTRRAKFETQRRSAES